MTIIEAIKTVMRRAGKALNAREAYVAILDQNLYEFRAKEPLHVVRMQIRRHCKGLDFPSALPAKHFKMKRNRRYYPLKVVEYDASRRYERTRYKKPL